MTEPFFRGPLEHDYRARVADWVISFRASEPALIAEFERVFGPAPSADGADPDVVISAVVGSPATPESGWLLRDQDGTLSLWTTNDGGAITTGRSSTVFTNRSATLSFADVADARDWMHTFATAVVNHVARTQNQIPAHSALVELDGSWLVLLGPSGVGKSTSSLAVARAGHRVAADDTCLLRTDREELLAHGLPRAPSLPLETHGLGDGRPVDYRERTSEPDFTLVAGWWPVAGVVLLRHGQQPDAQLEEVSAMNVISAAADAVSEALRTSLVVESAPRIMRALTSLPAVGLAIGTDPTRRLVTVERCLAEVAGRLTD